LRSSLRSARQEKRPIEKKPDRSKQQALGLRQSALIRQNEATFLNSTKKGQPEKKGSFPPKEKLSAKIRQIMIIRVLSLPRSFSNLRKYPRDT
jgi:hypothetical protein